MKKNEAFSDVSACVLAGGKSSRMGRDKSSLMINGMTMLEFQIKKLRDTGFGEVFVSSDKAVLPEKTVSDTYPQCGPIGGILSGLENCENSSCFFISVDCPLIPKSEIMNLVSEHLRGTDDITVLEHNGNIEPLIGVYRKNTAGTARKLIELGEYKVRRMYDYCRTGSYKYKDKETMLMNCNSESDYKAILCLFDEGET